MENSQILQPLNDVLTVKQSIILRTVSKTCKLYIKKRSIYKLFKQLNLSVDNVIKMIFEADQVFIEQESEEDYYLPIELHTFSEQLKKITYSKYFVCLEEFSDFLIDYGDHLGGTVEQYAYEHCVHFTDYKPLQGLLIELCVSNDI